MGKKVLIIGGPGTGKSTTLKALEKKGYTCYPEISREVILDAQKKGIEQLFLTDPLLFSQRLLEGRIDQFKKAEIQKDTVFIDRGIPDVTAYLDYKKDIYPTYFKEANLQYRYDLVFLFPIWEDIYMRDNERYENLTEAKEIQVFLEQTYRNLGYDLIAVPQDNVNNRVNFILSHC
ncbi:AAA family ATPase [Mesonia sp. HuA40]|uniref:AAA family ATPase n=1 Tax=Mesonia sp. HuA40 TaxID=2602761 RepID=UPI0011C85463|nr:ATP-binding protein [Mesonia sp. HuA40]TXK74743.1 ATP-binding protein [Mesonia sp. HuA40]